jgi:hypothetical protein
MLGCVPMDVASLCGTALEGVGSGWLSPVLGLISHLVQWALWSGLIRRLVCEQLLVPSTCPFSGGVGSRPAECISCVCIIQVWYFAEFQFVLQSSAFSRKIKEDREKKKKRRNDQWLFPRQTGNCASPILHQDFPSCYVLLNTILRISYWILCAPYVLVET